MSRMNNISNETTVGSDREISATPVKLTGLIFTPGTDASTLIVKDDTTTLFTMKGAANGPSIPVPDINVVVQNLKVNLAGTAAQVVCFHHPIKGT